MITRKIEKQIQEYYRENKRNALLVTGARQVGKTYTIRKFGEQFDSFIEINFYENKDAKTLFENAKNSSDILLRISAITSKELIPGRTLIFLDEVQECKEIVTAIKFLVEEGSYRYILSGSLLGVELKDIKSIPVGYMDIIQMYPIDFEEFIKANSVTEDVIKTLRNSFEKLKPVDSIIHEKMMELFRLYLIVGGMPAVVEKYLETNNIREVVAQQQAITSMYKADISRYDPEEKLYLEDIFTLIPSELNNKNKRFILKDLNENMKFNRFRNSFIWLKEAGVALPTFCVDEPVSPLTLSKTTNLFKLFLSDIGLLSSMYMDGIQIKILNSEKDINFGSIYENVAAQELSAHGYNLFYFNNKKQGEVDFVIEENGEVIPIEIKSGKDYKKHSALSNILSNEKYGISKAYVFHNGNISLLGKIKYYPIYMLMFVEKDKFEESLIYKPDLSILQK